MDVHTHAPSAAQSMTRWERLRTSKGWQRNLRHAGSYALLLAGSAFMLFPMLWIISASFKPGWQIFTQPPIWIPQHWEEVRAGSTNRMISLWQVEVDGEPQKVIELGVRRYTTVIDASKLQEVLSAPTDQLGEAAATDVNGITLNVREWATNGETRQVVALARGDGDTLIVADVAALQAAALRLPLDEVNGGDRAEILIGETEFRGRELAFDGSTLQVIPIGPESQLSVMGAPEIAASALLVPAESLSSAGFAQVGETELPLVAVEGLDGDYITLVSETWQPVIDEAEFDDKAFIAARAQMSETEIKPVNGVVMQVATYTPEDGAPVEVAVLVSGTTQSVVIPVEQATTLRLAQMGGLTSARGDQLNRIPYRVQDGFSEGGEGGETTSVALVGDTREMALVAPSAVVDEAFDVAPEAIQRAMYTQFRFDGYREALQTKVGETYFGTFFVNSFILVVLNAIGHVVSCIVVAYAFARLRAPGKNFFFVILLGTMMLPYPVTLVPVYEIFRDLGMVNTLWPLFLRSFFGNAFLIFMLRQFFMSIPRELEEAARIDGAHVLQIIRHVIVPLSKPAIATVIIFTFWWTWNSFLEPFIYLSSPELFPVSVGLNFFRDQYGTIFYDRLIAASVLSMVPMIVLFFFAQRYFIEGIQLSGLKG
ncbi:MAG: ABC transporter permease subunit [Anaerolineae bacterium]|nr:ABC transporter permease subunit [Anaerolineae bacterium]